MKYLIRKKLEVFQKELPFLSKLFTDNFKNFSCEFVCVCDIHPLLTSNPTDNIIPTTGQVEEVADHTTNTIMGGLTSSRSAIGGVYAKNQMDNKKNIQSVRDADQDLSEYIRPANKVWEHFFRFPDKKISEIMASVGLYRPTTFKDHIG